MAKVNDTNIFKFDTKITLNDYLFGSDGDDHKKNKSFKIADLAAFLKEVIYELDLSDKANVTDIRFLTIPQKQILDGISSDLINNWNKATFKQIENISISGNKNKTLTITRKNATPITVTFTDNDTKFNSLTWKTNTGDLEVTRTDGTVFTANLDSRYALLNHKHMWDEIEGKPINLATTQQIDALNNRLSLLENVERKGFQNDSEINLTANILYTYNIPENSNLFALILGGNSTLSLGTSVTNTDDLGEITGVTGTVLELGFLQNAIVVLKSNTSVSITPIIYKK